MHFLLDRTRVHQVEIQLQFFDVALLRRELIDQVVQPLAVNRVIPYTPLLSSGWALLKANRVRLHPSLDRLEGIMKDSPWALYGEAGWPMLKDALQQ